MPDFFDDGVGATVTATAVDEKAFRNGATTVTPRRVNHAPGVPIFGFRLDDGDSSMAYIPDVEYLDDAHRRPVLELADSIDLLIHGAHHTATEDENPAQPRALQRRGGCRLAREAGVYQIVWSHRHPDHNDDVIDGIASAHTDGDLSVEAVAERTEYVLEPS